MEPTTLISILGFLALAVLVALITVLARKGRTEDEARAYLAGFTYVLSDDPDAAIAELSRAAQLNRQTLETYFALGALFRRKGELDRAIRLHRNILLRPGLTLDVRRRAQLALAVDYRRSGLTDQARETLEKLLADDADHREALLHFRQVLEQSGAWDQAIETQSRLVKLDKEGNDVLAHLLAEASRSLFKEKPQDAEELARRGVELWPQSANAQLALAEARARLGRGVDAADPLHRALSLEPELAPKAVGLLTAIFASTDEIEAFLGKEIAARPDDRAPYELALALVLKARGDANRAVSLLDALVDRRPHFWEARKELGALLLEQNRSDALREEYQEVLQTLGRPALGFMCKSCRQKLPEHVFRCPFCELWDTVRREAPLSLKA